MLNCGRRGLALLLTASFALQPTIGLADTGAGSATAVQNHVEGVVNGQTQTLSSGSAIYSDELVRTAHNGVAELQFIDSTRLSVGPTSEVRLDKFVYDPQKGAGALCFRRPAVRIVLSRVCRIIKAIPSRLPYATLGVRGTVVEGN